MKKALLVISIFFITQEAFAQEKVEWIDIDEVWKKAAEYETESDYENALLEVEKVPKNDSTYYSALTSKSYYLISTEKYEEAIVVAKEGLKSKYQPFHYYFTVNIISATLGLEKYEETTTTIDKALKIYPTNYKLYYNKGVALEGLKKYAEAAKMYQKAITCKPFYANSHLKLAILCYDEHLITQTMMCLNMYLLNNPDGAGSFKILNSYNNMVKIKNDSKKHPGVKISEDDDTFEEIDLIINNYAALNKKYKISNKLIIPVIKQNHAMIGQLKDYEGNGGFWDKYYVPFYKFTDKNDLFDDFTYTIAFSVENEKYKAIVNKNISGIKSFIKKYQNEWFRLISINEAIVDGKKIEVKYLYNNGKVQGYGKYKDEKTIGKWKVFNDNGRISSIGTFDDEGKKHGKWKWFDKNGKIIEKGEYDHGELANEYLFYHDNGNLSVKAQYKEGKLNGGYKKYDENGALVESATYVDDLYEGEYLSYYSLGEGFVEYKIQYEKGKVEGKVFQYYPDQKIKSEMNFKDDNKEGETIIYYNIGQIDTKKNYSEGLLIGDYIEYHTNGNIYKKGKCEDGDFVGEWRTYFDDNTLATELSYSKGKTDGPYKRYERDGKLYYDYTYRKGEIIAYKFYSKNGEIIKEAKKQKGEFFYEGHAANGNITSEGIYDISGGKEGEWKYYSDNHVLESVENHKENLLQDAITKYYENGNIESITPYNNDTLEGYYVSYYINKKINQQGWYHKGELDGEWLSYYANGTLQKRNYYTNGKLYGTTENYGVDGTLTSEYFYFKNELKREYYYDTKGELMEEINIAVDSTNYHIENRFINGTINNSFAMLYKKRHGKYFGNYFSGKRSVTGDYFNGEYHGLWKWYYENGKIKKEGTYIHGNKNGVWKTYYKNGKLKTENHYEYGYAFKTEKTFNKQGVLIQTRDFTNNNLHGEINFYSEEGKAQLTRYYQHGELIGYGYLDKNGKPTPMISIKNETAKIVAYFDNGKISREMELRNGLFTGIYKEYYYTGQIFEEQKYENDEREGTFKAYYPDGTLMAEKPYNLGQLNGELKEYYPNGKLKEQTNYINNEKHGESKFYNESGKLIKEKTYFDDEVFSEKIYK
ncbi:MAG: hypothetical protein JKX68_13830 [Flavobacteriales bacterium]|nr:hypothetical protein [Flavobacteriales bacterium]